MLSAFSRWFAVSESDAVKDDKPMRVTAVIVALPAEIDIANADEVHQQLTEALSPGVGAAVADLTSTSFCDSSGVRAIIHAHKWAAARDVELLLAVSPGGSVHRVLRLTGVDRIIPVFASVQEAVRDS
jgi:anti-anti-sigma factor